jgi:hypothetical protein
MNNDQDIERRKKAFALVLDASSFILKAKGFRIHRTRAAIDALQGAGGGRDEFECSHLNLARRLDVGNEKEVSDDAKIRRVQRLLAVLEAEQARAGKKAFTIIRGGGFEHKKTKYIDNLTELAVLAAKQTQDRMQRENIEPSRFKIILEEESIKISDYLPDAVKKTADRKENPMPLDDDLYIQRECNHSVNSFERGLERWLKKGGDFDSFLELHQERLRKRAENLKSKMPDNAEIKTLEFSDVVSPAFSPENEAETVETSETDVLQNDSSQAAEPDLMQEALNLAEKGFRVFPVYEPTTKGCSCKAGENCERAGKHPRILDFPNAATTDKGQIKNWWQKWHRANIGIATGKGSNVIVLDVDANKGGDVSLSELFEDSDLPNTLTAKTGNGFHFFFQTVENIDIKNSVVKIGEGLDIRGENGFVVAAPSLHRNGNRYSWMNETKPCPMPEFLREKLIEIERQRTAQPIDYKQVNQISKSEFSNTNTSIIPESTRNERLFRKASALRGNGANEFEILERLREVNQTQCVPHLEESELQKIAQSVMRYLPNREKQASSVSVSTAA